MKPKKAFGSYLPAALLPIFFILLLLDPESVMASGKKAVDLCLNIIIPSLFPFFVFSRLILKTGAINFISRLFRPIMKPLFNLPGQAAFPLITGWFSGYPAGAKYTIDLYDNGLLTKKEAQRLLSFCNNSGPLFIVGAVGTGFFNSPRLGMVLLICHLLASVSVGIGYGLLSRLNGKSDGTARTIPAKDPVSFSGHMLTDAILDATKVLLQISGTIIFFAVLVQTLENAGIFTSLDRLLPEKGVYVDTLKAMVAGGLEITYGLFLLSSSAGIPMYVKVLLTSLLCGFGGFSVHTQVTGLCPGDIRLKEYFGGKLAHGILAAGYTGLFLANGTVPVMKADAALSGENTAKVLLMIYSFLIIGCILILIKRLLSQNRA